MSREVKIASMTGPHPSPFPLKKNIFHRFSTSYRHHCYPLSVSQFIWDPEGYLKALVKSWDKTSLWGEWLIKLLITIAPKSDLHRSVLISCVRLKVIIIIIILFFRFTNTKKIIYSITIYRTREDPGSHGTYGRGHFTYNNILKKE